MLKVSSAYDQIRNTAHAVRSYLPTLPELSFKIDPTLYTFDKLKSASYERVNALALFIFECLKKTWAYTNCGAQFAKKTIVNVIDTTKTMLVKIATSRVFSRDVLKYTSGPLLSLAMASIVRLSLGKRVPTSGPLYLSIGTASFVLLSFLGYQYFSHPRTQKKIQQKGFMATVHEAIPVGHAKVCEPLLTRYMLGSFSTINLVKGMGLFKTPEVLETDAKQMLIQLKRFSDWVAKKIKPLGASKETLQVLKEEYMTMMSVTIQHLSLLGSEALIRDFLTHIEADEILKRVVSDQDRKQVITQFGYRTCVLNGKIDLLPLLREPVGLSPLQRAFDAIVSKNLDLMVSITNTEAVDVQEVSTFTASIKDTGTKFGLISKKSNLVQVAVLLGNIEVLRRTVASSDREIDWEMRDDQGLGVLHLAALSGSKNVWDFIKAQKVTFPKREEKEFLELLYCSLKGKNLQIFDEVQGGIFDVDDLPINRALIEDLYEKSVLFGAEEISESILSHVPKLVEAMTVERLKTILFSSVRSGKKTVFDSIWPTLLAKAKSPTENFKAELLLNLLNSSEFNQDLAGFILELGVTLHQTAISTFQGFDEHLLAKNLCDLPKELQEAILNKFDQTTFKSILKKKGPLLSRFIRSKDLMEYACAKKAFSVQELYDLARESIRLGKHETLDLLIDQGIDVLRKLSIRDESLLHLAAISFNTKIMETILRKCPPLSAATIAELKAGMAELKCHTDDEEVIGSINRMLDVKSLGRGSQPAEDPLLQLALNKARSMEFEGRILSDPAETRARSLLGAGLSLFGY